MVDGLGLLPVETIFGAHKVLGRPRRNLARGNDRRGVRDPPRRGASTGRAPLFADEGCRVGSVGGTSWHGLLENDAFRRSLLTETARRAGRAFAVSPDTSFGDVREARFEMLADMVAEHLDTEAVMRIIEGHTERYARLEISSAARNRRRPVPQGPVSCDARARMLECSKVRGRNRSDAVPSLARGA